MDNETIEAYDRHCTIFFNKYSNSPTGISKYFRIAFPKKCIILDIGSGSGKDLSILLEQGHHAIGIEPSSALINLSVTKYPALRGKLSLDGLPELASVADEMKFDGILCSAVLMHIPNIQLFDSFFSIKKHLKNNGRLLISIPNLYPDVNERDGRDFQGRLFNQITAGQIILILERLGLRLIEKWDDEVQDGIRSIHWTTLLFTLEFGDFVKPLDSIEAIINKDRKVASYKLALFRAMAEIATTHVNAVKWSPDGFVLLPIDLVIDKWIDYYWPIFSNKEFFPQIQNEKISTSHPVSFRKLLTELANYYSMMGGYEGFYIDRARMKINTGILETIGRLRSVIARTIISGPVKYAGGSSAGNALFSYDGNQKSIVIPELIWKELTLLGNWIADASILRWAELTSKFSKGKVKPSTVIDLLLIQNRNRQIEDARSIIAQTEKVKCVWTYCPINRFEVDHIIPFSLWKNNDLWNLMPAKPSINREKSDKLVTVQQLVKSKDIIIDYWKLYVKNDDVRFYGEAAILTGPALIKRNWEFQLFSRLNEAIEYTALQRGMDRWESVT